MGDQSRKKRVLVYFIGGITYGEIAALRFLNKIFKDKKFIVATTQIINGDNCVQMLRGPSTTGSTSPPSSNKSDILITFFSRKHERPPPALGPSQANEGTLPSAPAPLLRHGS